MKQDVATDQRAVLMAAAEPEHVVRHVQIMVEAHLVADKLHLVINTKHKQELVLIVMERQDITVLKRHVMFKVLIMVIVVEDMLEQIVGPNTNLCIHIVMGHWVLGHLRVLVNAMRILSKIVAINVLVEHLDIK